MAYFWLIIIKKAWRHFKAFAYSTQYKFWGITHVLMKTGSNAIQHGISFCVALQCVIKRRTFQGNHVLYRRGTVANHLQSGRISPVGNRVWWVLDWVWWVRSFAHSSLPPSHQQVIAEDDSHPHKKWDTLSRHLLSIYLFICCFQGPLQPLVRCKGSLTRISILYRHICLFFSFI